MCCILKVLTEILFSLYKKLNMTFVVNFYMVNILKWVYVFNLDKVICYFGFTFSWCFSGSSSKATVCLCVVRGHWWERGGILGSRKRKTNWEEKSCLILTFNQISSIFMWWTLF